MTFAIFQESHRSREPICMADNDTAVTQAPIHRTHPYILLFNISARIHTHPTNGAIDESELLFIHRKFIQINFHVRYRIIRLQIISNELAMFHMVYELKQWECAVVCCHLSSPTNSSDCGTCHLIFDTCTLYIQIQRRNRYTTVAPTIPDLIVN